MEKRVLLAIALCFLTLYVWQTLVVKPVVKPVNTTAPVTASTTTNAATGVPAPAASTAPTAAAVVAATAAPAEAPLVGDAQERDVRIETRDVIAVFTNRGGRLKSWRLKHYLDQDKQPQELIVSLDSQPLPFTLRAGDDHTTATLNAGLYTVSGVPAERIITAPARLRFEYSTVEGLHAVKEFELPSAGYIVTFTGTVTTSGGETGVAAPYTIHWGAAVGDITENSRYVKKAEGLLFQNGKARRLAPKDFASQPTSEGDFGYAGVDDNYFMTVALYPGPSKVTYQAVTIPAPANTKDPARELVAYAIEPQTSGPKRFFAGPKDFDVLDSISHDVASAIDFGMFRVLVVPLLKSLKGVNRFVGNYGWSIILLTIIINAIMFPLRHKSVVSMRKMQEIQPEVKAIQDRYSKLKATDPAKQKMNTEMMALYRERGVNPASGCVPMLLTMPVLIAFYALLSGAIELRGAPFVGWIHDLSLHDPLYITPVLMGVTMVWQQRLAPAAGADPAQQKMMMFMPIVFTFMFLWAPAGVAVYWLMSNLWAIGQQYATNYMIGPPNIRNFRPPAERRVKRVGGGKTEAASRE
jgi:YidC/Oxa1 family membrane protein insertase